ncbi:MAG: hypothetical protein ABI578_06890 [Chloroflexota bacterium]
MAWSVTEASLLPWVREEAARLQAVDGDGEPIDAVKLGAVAEEERASLAARRQASPTR